MEIIFELLFEFLGEYVLAFLVELVSSAFGSVFGSVWLFPASVAKTQDVRLAVLIGVPIACGLSMGLIGSFKRKRGREAAAVESFRNGFLFALPFVAIRFFFAH